MTKQELAKKMLAHYVEPQLCDLINPAFAGDADSASALASLHGKRQRSVIARICYEGEMPKESFREVLGAAWNDGHDHLIDVVQCNDRLRNMFQYANFQLPDELPETIQVWRGVAGISATKARQGLSWTTDRDVACWFAVTRNCHKGKPLVITAHIQKSDVAYCSNDRTEQELLLLNPPMRAKKDGTLIDWQAGSNARVAAVEAGQKASIEEAQRERSSTPTAECEEQPTFQPLTLIDEFNEAEKQFSVFLRRNKVPGISLGSEIEDFDFYAKYSNQTFAIHIDYATKHINECTLTKEDFAHLYHDQFVSLVANIIENDKLEASEYYLDFFEETAPESCLFIIKIALMVSGSAYEPFHEITSSVFKEVTALKDNTTQWNAKVAEGAALLDTTKARQEEIEELLNYTEEDTLLVTYQFHLLN